MKKRKAAKAIKTVKAAGVSAAAVNRGEFVSVREAVEITKSSEPTIRRRLTNGELQRYKFFGRTLINYAELMSHIKPESGLAPDVPRAGA